MASGKMPFSRKMTPDEINKVIFEGKYNWSICNDEISPRLSVSIEKEELNQKGKPKKIFFSISSNGSVYVTGAKSRKEIEELYENILKEFSALCPRLFN